ncbi:hypothetical protein PGB90_000004 [Kerria lacca]
MKKIKKVTDGNKFNREKITDIKFGTVIKSNLRCLPQNTRHTNILERCLRSLIGNIDLSILVQDITRTNSYLEESLLSRMSSNDLQISKKYAAEKAVRDREFKGNMIVGIGSGSTVVYVTKCIAETITKINKEAENDGRKSDLNVICIPSSFQAKQLILENNLNLGSLELFPLVDWTIDGADEVDQQNNIIKGGGGCHTQEKILASFSKELYIVGDYTKYSPKLGTSWKKGIPIEVIPVSYVAVKKKIQCCLGGEVLLRMAVMKAGPVITDNSNFIVDWRFPEGIDNWKDIETTIKMIPGVVEVGLFINMAVKVYIGTENDVKLYDYSLSNK